MNPALTVESVSKLRHNIVRGLQHVAAVYDTRKVADRMAASDALLAACEAGVQTIEQLIPEPSARGVADVVLFQLRAAIRLATGAQP